MQTKRVKQLIPSSLCTSTFSSRCSSGRARWSSSDTDAAEFIFICYVCTATCLLFFRTSTSALQIRCQKIVGHRLLQLLNHLSVLPILQRDTCILERGSHSSRGLLKGSCLLHSIKCLYDITFLPFIEIIYPNTTL